MRNLPPRFRRMISLTIAIIVLSLVMGALPFIHTQAASSIKVQIDKGGGTDNTQETTFNFLVKNTGTAAVSGITTQIYFTPDGSNAASGYTLEKYYDQSGVATISGPTLLSGTTYYFTVNYGTASLAAGGQWEFQTALHLSSWASTYSGANDYYHTGYAVGALPAAYTDTNYIPAYVSGTLAWGTTPGSTGTATKTFVPPATTVVPPPTTAVPTTPSGSLPDLVVSSITNAAPTIPCGTGFNPGTNVTVTNNGTAAAGSFTVSLSNGGGTPLTMTVSSLAAGASVTFRFNQNGGQLTAVADSTNAITESNETNNSKSATLAVSDPLMCTFTPTPGTSTPGTPTITPTVTCGHPVVSVSPVTSPTSALTQVINITGSISVGGGGDWAFTVTVQDTNGTTYGTFNSSSNSPTAAITVNLQPGITNVLSVFGDAEIVCSDGSMFFAGGSTTKDSNGNPLNIVQTSTTTFTNGDTFVEGTVMGTNACGGSTVVSGAVVSFQTKQVAITDGSGRYFADLGNITAAQIQLSATGNGLSGTGSAFLAPGGNHDFINIALNQSEAPTATPLHCSATPTGTQPPLTLTPTPSSTDIIIHGQVTQPQGCQQVAALDSIYVSVNGKPSTFVARTDSNGNYTANIGNLGGQSTPIVVSTDYQTSQAFAMSPQYYLWTHTGGTSENKTLNFTVVALSGTPTPTCTTVTVSPTPFAAGDFGNLTLTGTVTKMGNPDAGETVTAGTTGPHGPSSGSAITAADGSYSLVIHVYDTDTVSVRVAPKVDYNPITITRSGIDTDTNRVFNFAFSGPTITPTLKPTIPADFTPSITPTPVTPTKTNTPTITLTPTKTNTPGGSDPCASPTVISGGGSFNVTTATTCFKYVNTSFVNGGMFSVMKDGTSASDTIKWYGGMDQNTTACTNQSSSVSGNGGQLNNFTVSKDANGQMFLIVTGSASNSITLSIQNWQNGAGCSVKPTVHP